MANERPNPSLSLTSLSLADAAKFLARSGSRRATEAILRADVATGAPVNPDGTLNLIHYAAWLVKEMAVGA
ncbi:MAG: hypothetical protein AMXMBFR7_53180 [Planctomycetota bacterium]